MAIPTAKGLAGRQIIDREIAVAYPSPATFGVKQPMVRRETGFGSRGREPSILGDHVNRVKATGGTVWNEDSRTRVVLVRQPIEHSFDADDGGSELIVGPYLTATGKNSIVSCLLYTSDAADE